MDLASFLEAARSRWRFERGVPLVVTRAPGRLDVMGGIADYSGALVLQRPIAEATFAAVQRVHEPVLQIVSEGRPPYQLALEALERGGEPITYTAARALFAASHEDRWVSYVAGMLLVLVRERALTLSGGLHVAVASSVPEGKGVSSSAAVETAVMQALATAFDVALAPRELALLCQLGENLVAGAPCGVMDQMTCVFGEADALMALLCQPAELQQPVRVPSDVTLWGLDSGERHAVGGSDYAAVRIGTFMGHRILAERADVAKDYLANVSPAHFDHELAQGLPEQMSGHEFLSTFGGTADPVTTVDPSRVYKIRVPASHPVHEHHRVQAFRQLLLEPPGAERRRRLGDLMYQSHASYGACGLGSPGTDLLVDLVRAEGPRQDVYGARITGGGSGGTVVVLGGPDAAPAIARIAVAYEQATRYRPYVFSGASSGVASFGALKLSL